MCPHQGDDPWLASRIRRIHDVEIRVHHTQLRPPGRFRSPLPLHIPKSLPRVLVDRTVDLHGQPVPAIREVRVDLTATRGSDLDISLPPGEAMVLQHEPRIGLQRRVHSDDRAQHRAWRTLRTPRWLSNRSRSVLRSLWLRSAGMPRLMPVRCSQITPSMTATSCW